MLLLSIKGEEMQKKTLFILLLFLSIFSSNLLACGCVNASSASSGANEIMKTYDNADNKVAQIFADINKMIKQINKNELENFKNSNKIKNITIENTKEMKKINFSALKIINIKKREKQ